jgi:hypothetical protein
MDDLNSNAMLAARPAEVIDRQEDCGAVFFLQQEKKELETAVRKLEDSNIDLREALNGECSDPVYKDAIGVSPFLQWFPLPSPATLTLWHLLPQENIVTIAKYKARIQYLQNLISTVLTEGSEATLHNSLRGGEEGDSQSYPEQAMDIDESPHLTNDVHGSGRVGANSEIRVLDLQVPQERTQIRETPESGLWL